VRGSVGEEEEETTMGIELSSESRERNYSL